MQDILKVIQDAMHQKTHEQELCSHVISSRMSDGKYFCPTCGLVSGSPLYGGKA
jgi:hypothetical protein